MFGIETVVVSVLEHLLASEIGHGLHRSYKGLRFLPYQVHRRNEDMRVAFSALLRLKEGDRFILVRNLHRRETFCPFGGVYKYVDAAQKHFDKLEFRPQVVGPRRDMEGDLQGFLPRHNAGSLVRWFWSERDRESSQECLYRELKEELREANITNSAKIPEQRHFKLVRRILDGPRRVPGEHYRQFRVFEIFDINNPNREVRALTKTLVKAVRGRSTHLILATSEEIKRGRTRKGDVIGHISCYLIGRRRLRPDEPMF